MTARHLTAALLALVLLAVLAAAALRLDRWTSEVCYEDMPCWNCATMGNLQCGGLPELK